MQHRFSTNGPVSLSIEIGRGSVTLYADDTAETLVEVTGPDPERFSVTQSGRQIAIRGPRHALGLREAEYQVEVRLPRDSEISGRTGSADVAAHGRYAGVTLRSGSGDVSVEEVTGESAVDTGSGGIELATVRGAVRVKSGSGDVHLGATQAAVGVSTGSGDVTVGSASGGVVLKTGSGDLTVQRGEGDLDVVTASGDITVGHLARGGLRARSASGDLDVAIPRGVPVWTDVRSVSGRVTSDLESTGAPVEGQDHVEVRATTVSGDVLLHQA